MSCLDFLFLLLSVSEDRWSEEREREGVGLDVAATWDVASVDGFQVSAALTRIGWADSGGSCVDSTLRV